jgi:hypothetical protein
MALLRDAFRLAKKKLARRGGGSPPPTVTGDEGTDLGLQGGGTTLDGVPQPGTDMTEAGLPAAAIAGIQVSPTHVVRNKCPKGYTLVHMSGFLGIPHAGDTCVLTKVARALGLARHRRGRGISARDLRAALRVTRLVRHMEKQLPHHVVHRRLSAGKK